MMYDWCPPFRQPGPQAEPPTRLHLLYHVFPNARTDVWRRNIAQLRRRLHLFDGHRLVGVIVGAENLDPVHDVGEALGWEADIIPIAHDERTPSEVQSLRELLPRLRSESPQEAIFFAHTKGAGYCPPWPADRDPIAVMWWRNAMYHWLLDRWDLVLETLRRWPCCGIFKTVHKQVDNRHTWPTGFEWGQWHYSGTFWWVRSYRLFGDPRWPFIPYDRFGAEAYLGGIFCQEEAPTLYQPYPPEGPIPVTAYSRAFHTLRISDEETRSYSVVITCKGRLEHLRHALRCWLAQSRRPDEIIVVDYGCPQNTAEHVRREFPGVRPIRIETDAWHLNHARNIGGCAARGTHLVFADADFLPGPDWLARVDAEFSAGADVVLHSWQDVVEGQTVARECGQAAIASEWYHRLRGYDEAFIGYGYDDIDLYERARRAGADIHRVWSAVRIGHGDEIRARDGEGGMEATLARNRRIMDTPNRVVNPGGYGRLQPCN